MTEFLERITWRDAWLTLETNDAATLPPYLGSTLRGALGHLLRSELCDGQGCGHECQNPGSCRYFSLFEQSRNATGQNAPKPMILLPPRSPGLETVAWGGPVNLPLRTAPPRMGESIPVLSDESRLKFQPGDPLRFGIRLLGAASPLAPALIDAVARHGLNLAGSPFHLTLAQDGRGTMLFDRRFPKIPAQMPALERLASEAEPASRVRLVFLTPTVLKLERKPVFDPIALASRFFEHSLARAAQVCNAFSGGPHIPWLEPPQVYAEISGYRLFHYELPRRSYRQEKWLDFDGIVGYLDLEGNLACGLPFARAAEILHFGQKAAFGQGQVRLLVLD